MSKKNLKLVFGSVCVLFNIALLVTGVTLIFQCLPSIGEGEATATVRFLGNITGINGHLVGLFLGVACMVVAVVYTFKSFTEARSWETKALPDVVRHHSPLTQPRDAFLTNVFDPIRVAYLDFKDRAETKAVFDDAARAEGFKDFEGFMSAEVDIEKAGRVGESLKRHDEIKSRLGVLSKYILDYHIA